MAVKNGASKGAKNTSIWNEGNTKDLNIAQHTVTNADKAGNTPAWKGYKSGKTKKDGTPLYKPAPHLKGV